VEAADANRAVDYAPAPSLGRKGDPVPRVAIPGRFQPFHEGHSRTVDRDRDGLGEFVLAVGSSETSRTPENPLTAAERTEIVRARFPGHPVVEPADENRGEPGYEGWTRRPLERSLADVIVTATRWSADPSGSTRTRTSSRSGYTARDATPGRRSDAASGTGSPGALSSPAAVATSSPRARR
jgi:cytidyltransferase-like protein